MGTGMRSDVVLTKDTIIDDVQVQRIPGQV